MTARACAFSGHRTLPKNICDIRNSLASQIEYLVSENNITVFLSGGARGFDTLAAEVVLSLREKLPDIRLHMVLPCRDQDRYWPARDKLRYSYILSRADEIIYISETYDDACMLKRNRYLIDNSAVCLCYRKARSGGTAYTINYAKKQNRKIINLAEHQQTELSFDM